MAKIKFSIVIALAPWRNAEILDYIKKQTYPNNKFEVIVVKGTNVPDNRNKGVKKAKGEIIVFLDDDGMIKEDYLQNLDNFLTKNKGVDVVGGPQLTPESDGTFAKASGYAMSNPFGAGGIYKRYSNMSETLDADSNYITGANFVARKKVFKKLNFPRDIYPGDDVHFINRAKEKGFVVAFTPQITIYHRRRPTLFGLTKQVYGYAIARTNNELFKRMGGIPFFLVPSFFVLYLASLYFLAKLSNLFFVPGVIYILCLIFFSVYESGKNNHFGTVFYIPFIFLDIHISYGIGLIIGMVKNIFKHS